MGKLNIPKAKQIKGLRKAIANRKTPRQFIPSLKKRLAKLTACIVFALIASSAHAQTPVIIQPTQQVLATSTACTGSSQTFTVNNRNQTRHYASIITTNVTQLQMTIFGVDSSGNSFLISDVATNGAVSNGGNPVLTAVGYYPTVNVVVTCFPASTATFTLSYSGSSAASGENAGGYLLTQVDKTLVSGFNAGTNFNITFQPPFANSLGNLIVNYSGTGPTGSTIQVSCLASSETVSAQIFTFTPSTTAGVQSIAVPPTSCPVAVINYNAGGANANTIRVDYTFPTAGTTIPNSYTHIAGTTATVVKAGPGTVHSLVIGTSAAGTITLFDLASTSCTGTPATNVVSIITEFASATPPPPPYIFDTLFVNGICLKASAAMDITVSSQ
jgi:hypothetical protein